MVRTRRYRHKCEYFNNPLECFLLSNEYDGLSRSELSRVDSGLYRSLLRDGQMELAIPKKNPAGRHRLND